MIMSWLNDNTVLTDGSLNKGWMYVQWRSNDSSCYSGIDLYFIYTDPFKRKMMPCEEMEKGRLKVDMLNFWMWCTLPCAKF